MRLVERLCEMVDTVPPEDSTFALCCVLCAIQRSAGCSSDQEFIDAIGLTLTTMLEAERLQ